MTGIRDLWVRDFSRVLAPSSVGGLVKSSSAGYYYSVLGRRPGILTKKNTPWVVKDLNDHIGKIASEWEALPDKKVKVYEVSNPRLYSSLEVELPLPKLDMLKLGQSTTLHMLQM